MAKKKSKKRWSGFLNADLTQFTEADRAVLFEQQGGKCAICGKSEYEFKRKLAVDHNHRTMIVRGLLCYYDNRFSVGRISSDNAIKVAKYLNPNLTIFIF